MGTHGWQMRGLVNPAYKLYKQQLRDKWARSSFFVCRTCLSQSFLGFKQTIPPPLINTSSRWDVCDSLAPVSSGWHSQNESRSTHTNGLANTAWLTLELGLGLSHIWLPPLFVIYLFCVSLQRWPLRRVKSICERSLGCRCGRIWQPGLELKMKTNTLSLPRNASSNWLLRWWRASRMNRLCQEMIQVWPRIIFFRMRFSF